MNLYLQRLLDRAAAVPPRVVSANPLLVTGSPILTFDQRLASAEMADDYSILGATPELPEAAEERPLPAGLPAPNATPGAAPPRSPAAVEPRAEIPAVAAPARPRSPDTGDAAPSELAKAAETGGAAPVLPHPSLDAQTVEPPSRPGRPRLDPILPPVPPVSARPEPDRPAVPSRAPADPSPVPAEPLPAPVISEARHPGPPSTAETGLAEPRPAAPVPPEARPLPSVAPAARETAPAIPEPSASEPRPAAEPIVAPIPPLAPPPRGLSVEEVERMIDEAIGAERDRGAAGGSANVRNQQAQPPGPRGEAPAKRPATAAQASLIGSLESSRFRPMLFGVRRR